MEKFTLAGQKLVLYQRLFGKKIEHWTFYVTIQEKGNGFVRATNICCRDVRTINIGDAMLFREDVLPQDIVQGTKLQLKATHVCAHANGNEHLGLHLSGITEIKYVPFMEPRKQRPYYVRERDSQDTTTGFWRAGLKSWS